MNKHRLPFKKGDFLLLAVFLGMELMILRVPSLRTAALSGIASLAAGTTSGTAEGVQDTDADSEDNTQDASVDTEGNAQDTGVDAEGNTQDTSVNAESSDGSLYVLIRVAGEEIQTLPLGEENTVTVETDYGSNVIAISEGKVRMASSDCRNQICVNTGAIHTQGQMIVCLPHRLSVEIIAGSEEDQTYDAIAY